MFATLVIPADFPAAVLTQEYCRAALTGVGGQITPAVIAAIDDAISARQPGTEAMFIIAKAVEPVHGEDGSLCWQVQANGNAVNWASASSDDDGTVKLPASYYERCAYTMVKRGQVLAKVMPPGIGADGRDILGRSIAAKPGKPVPIRCDDTVLQTSAGELIAQVEGVLQVNGESIRISPRLEVSDYVDFSTGNLDFAGTIVVAKGVRDCFVIKAGGSVEVAGLIEAATVHCGGNLAAKGGIAGRERGEICVGGNVVARYLDSVKGRIGGDLGAEREVIACQLLIGGQLLMPHSAVIGGSLEVRGNVDVGTLGSPGGTATRLIVGPVWNLHVKLAQLEQIIEQLMERQQAMEEERRQLAAYSKSLSAQEKERQTELSFQLEGLRSHMTKALIAREALQRDIQAGLKVTLTVRSVLHEQVWLTLGSEIFRIETAVKGPLIFHTDDQGHAFFRRSNGAPMALSQIARRSAAAA
jgi:uncharacterized protein (DUF342 family)